MNFNKTDLEETCEYLASMVRKVDANQGLIKLTLKFYAKIKLEILPTMQRVYQKLNF